MKKRIAFAYVTIIMDFATQGDAKEYKHKNITKYWRFSEIRYTGNSEYPYSMEITKPYGKYPTGY